MTAMLPTTQPRRWFAQRANRRQAANRRRVLAMNRDDAELFAEFLVEDYARAVTEGEDRHGLSAILTGISGCLLTQSACWYAQGWSDDAERDRLSGLLIGEVAACASENPSRLNPPGYRGARSPEFQADPIASALRDLATAYRGPLVSGLDGGELVVWGCLAELIDQVLDVTPGTWPGPVVLADLCDAHFEVRS